MATGKMTQILAFALKEQFTQFQIWPHWTSYIEMQTLIITNVFLNDKKLSIFTVQKTNYSSENLKDHSSQEINKPGFMTAAKYFKTVYLWFYIQLWTKEKKGKHFDLHNFPKLVN